jgi:hypothetical protein
MTQICGSMDESKCERVDGRESVSAFTSSRLGQEDRVLAAALCPGKWPNGHDYTATAIADYAVRARPGAPVALPIDWRELKNLQSADQFSIKDVLKRVKDKLAKSPVPPQTLPAV